MKIDQESNRRYVPPRVKVLRLSTRTNVLNTSFGGNPSLTEWNKDGGSDSFYGFGDD